MTVLIGFKDENKVIITGDMKSSHINNITGENQGTYNPVLKVLPISENMIIGIGGYAALGESIQSMLRSIFRLSHSLSIEGMIKHIEKTCNYAYDLFKEVHPERRSDLLFIVAGIEKETKKSYLYRISSEDGFVPKEMGEENLLVRGTEQENKVKSYLISKSNSFISVEEFMSHFSAAIRSIDDVLVSKECFSISIELEDSKYKHKAYFTDHQGILHTPSNLNL